ncbi:hypothetical protein D3C87_694460 [compost metagenome]
MASVNTVMALSWPNTTILRLRSRFFSTSLSEEETDFSGMRAIFATMASISGTLITFLRLLTGNKRCPAPASSITSMALSGRWRSLMYLAESSTAARMALTV